MYYASWTCSADKNLGKLKKEEKKTNASSNIQSENKDKTGDKKVAWLLVGLNTDIWLVGAKCVHFNCWALLPAVSSCHDRTGAAYTVPLWSDTSEQSVTHRLMLASTLISTSALSASAAGCCLSGAGGVAVEGVDSKKAFLAGSLMKPYRESRVTVGGASVLDRPRLRGVTGSTDVAIGELKNTFNCPLHAHTAHKTTSAPITGPLRFWQKWDWRGLPL